MPIAWSWVCPNGGHRDGVWKRAPTDAPARDNEYGEIFHMSRWISARHHAGCCRQAHLGTIELAISQVRPGPYVPSLLQPRRLAEHALLAVVQEAYVHGVSTRKVDELMQALGLDGVSTSQVSQSAASSIRWGRPVHPSPPDCAPVVEIFRRRASGLSAVHQLRLPGRLRRP